MTTKKTKILPIKVWLDQDSCWDEKPQDSNGYVEYVRGDYHSQALLHVLHKGVEKGKKKMLENTCKWLKENKDHYAIECEDTCFSAHLTDDFIKDFRKEMEE